MKTIYHIRHFLMAFMLLTGVTATAQSSKTIESPKNSTMKTYLIERNIPSAGSFNADQLKGISQTSCGVLKEMGPQIKWIHSYVTGDKIYCVYQAENEELLKEHGLKGGFPVDNIMEIANTISPATAEN